MFSQSNYTLFPPLSIFIFIFCIQKHLKTNKSKHKTSYVLYAGKQMATLHTQQDQITYIFDSQQSRLYAACSITIFTLGTQLGHSIYVISRFKFPLRIWKMLLSYFNYHVFVAVLFDMFSSLRIISNCQLIVSNCELIVCLQLSVNCLSPTVS